MVLSSRVSSSGNCLYREKTERGLLLLQVIMPLLAVPCTFLFVWLVSPPAQGSLGPGELRVSHTGSLGREQEGKSLVRSFVAAAPFS